MTLVGPLERFTSKRRTWGRKMSVSTNAIVNFMNLGVRGIQDPAPDGFFAAEVSLIGDASGGTSVLDLILGSSTDDRPNDIMMKLSWVAYTHDGSFGLNSASIRLVPQLPFGSSGDVRLKSAELMADSLNFEPANGMWFFPQKGATFYLRGICDNPGVAVTNFLSCQGEYWYMGRLRRLMVDSGF